MLKNSTYRTFPMFGRVIFTNCQFVSRNNKKGFCPQIHSLRHIQIHKHTLLVHVSHTYTNIHKHPPLPEGEILIMFQ